MKRVTLIAPILVLATAGLFLLAQNAPAPAALDRLFPAGSLLYLEARDLGGLLRDWDASPEKKLWLASDNYQVFSRSRLLLRLQQAQGEYAAAAGLPPDMALVNSVAGGASALAIYDIGKLEFVYISRLPSARAVQSALYQKRGVYESRSAAGQAYFVRRNPQAERVAAFAVVNDLLLLSTREDLLAGSLALTANQARPALPGESWYVQAVKATQAAGELRLVMNLPRLVATPYFRSYWVQRNVSALRPFRTGISDLVREGSSFREQRVFLRQEPGEAMAAREPAVAQLLAYAEPDSGLVRAWAAPAADTAAALLYRRLLAPTRSAAPPSESAPAAAGDAGLAGSEADLEARIDEAPLPGLEAAPDATELRKLLAAVPLDAMMQVESSRTLPDGYFLGSHTAIVLLAGADWNAAGVNAALPADNTTVRGRVLIASDSPSLREAIAARLNQPPAAGGAVYTAVYRHARELAPFGQWMGMIEHSPDRSSDQPPPFFAGNVASFGRAIARLQTASIIVHDTGAGLEQQVRYEVSP